MKRVFKILTIFVLLPLLLATFITSVNAKEKSNTMVVGWFESNFNITDDYGRRSGYSYEYQQKLSVYTGWEYEYKEGSWPELLEMLINGEIDILSDVSYTEERAEKMYFSSEPMGTEDYYLYKAPSNNSIKIDDYSTFNGKKVGINKNSVMNNYFNSWAEKNHIDAEIVPLVKSVDDALIMLNKGEIDLYVNMDGSLDISEAIPLCKIGSSDFYFAVSKNSPEIAEELDRAMINLLEDDPYFEDTLHAKYFKSSGINLYLNEDEKALINKIGKIKIGYQDNYLAFCAKDSKTGKLTGALSDYLNLASNCFKNGQIEFEPVAYSTASLAFEALKKGEIDCMFPANLSVYEGEIQGLFMTKPFIKTEIVAVVPKSEQKNFLEKDRITVAVNAGNPNYELFLKENFPKWTPIGFENTNECLDGIYAGKADCLLISNYRFNNLAAKCTEYDLVSLSTGVELDYSFAVNRDDTTILSILNKVVNNVPESSVNSAVSRYYTEDAKLGIGDYFNRYIGIIMIVLGVIALVILVLIFRIVIIDRKSKSRQMLIKATEIDEITGLYNKIYFLEYANNMYNNHQDKHMDAIALYIEHFHSISDIYGMKIANQLLKEVSDEITSFLKKNGGIAGYSIDGRFCMYIDKFDDYQGLYDRIQGRIDMSSSIPNVRIRMGVMPWVSDNNSTQLIDNAIKACSMTLTEYNGYLIVIDERMKNKEERNKKLLNDIRSAIDNSEFKVYYQPKYDISSDEIKIVGAEALLRWVHPELGIIEPNDFITLFEKNGEIDNVDRYVRGVVVKQMSLWKEKYGVVLPISINVSRMEILDQTFEDSLNVLIDESNIGRESLILEIAESSVIENINQFVNVINRLRSHGYKVELDDFGMGYSSLKMLSSMNVDTIKIDGSFIENIGDEKEETIIKIILNLANSINVSVIAEGVETKDEMLELRKLGCNIAQGFYLAKPMLANEFEDTFFKK